MKSTRAAWRALRYPVTLGEAAKLLGVKIGVVRELVDSLDLLTIEVQGAKMIPPCELKRFRPLR